MNHWRNHENHETKPNDLIRVSSRNEKIYHHCVLLRSRSHNDFYADIAYANVVFARLSDAEVITIEIYR